MPRTTIKETLDAARMVAKVSTEPLPTPPRPNATIAWMPAQMSIVGKTLLQEVILLLLRSGHFSPEEVDTIFVNAAKPCAGNQVSEYILAQTQDQIGWDLAYGEPSQKQPPAATSPSSINDAARAMIGRG
jgi:hypothetical protein